MAIRSREKIIDAALLRCGRGIASQEVNLAQVIDANYDEIVRAAFEDGDGNYPFGRRRETLTSRSEGRLGYDDAYKVPDGALQIVEVYFNKCAAADILEPWDFDGETGSVVLNAGGRTIEIEMVFAGLEHHWSANFAKGIQRRLEAVIKDFLEELEESMVKDQEADALFMKAGIKASKNRSQRRMFKPGGGRLVRARRTPGSY